MQACIIKLAQELELRPEVVPSGAVVAFATECPQPGWEEYKEGWGRFIVGAVSAQRLKEIPGGFFRDSGGRDLTPKPIGEPGGEASHILTVEEMPPHTHGLNRSKGSDLSNNVILYSGSVVSTESGDPPQTHPIGGGLPHNNMPPYVALQLCKKK
jgi:hypothetical protein